MDLRTAIRVVQTELSLPVESSVDLAYDVNTLSSPLGTLEPVATLNREHLLKPLDVLLALALATRAHVQDDVLSAYQSWAVWRYLGVFDGWIHGHPFQLALAGTQIRGNQRRVMSEELGIGFAVKIAEQWINSGSDPNVVVRTVDIDDALFLGHAGWGSSYPRVSVESVASRRPDYLVVADDPFSTSRFTLGSLESKGTSAPNNLKQLRSGNDQLKGVLVDGTQQPGLVAGTILNAHGVASAALQLSLPETVHNRGFEPVEVDLEYLDGGRSWQEDARRWQHPKEALVGDALSASLANLGDIAGKDEAFGTWASPSTKSRRNFTGSARKEERKVSHLDGEPLVGTSIRIPLPGGTLRIFTGVGEELVSTLLTGDAERALISQKNSKSRAEYFSERSEDTFSSQSIEAFSDDGAVVVIEADFDS
jgi:hypothetical protein